MESRPCESRSRGGIATGWIGPRSTVGWNLFVLAMLLNAIDSARTWQRFPATVRSVVAHEMGREQGRTGVKNRVRALVLVALAARRRGGG